MKHAKKLLYVVAANFGVGKTSICNYYPNEETDIPGLRQVDAPFADLFTVGGPRGTDDLNGMGFNKQRALEELINGQADKNLLIHGIFYQQIVDLDRYSATHDIHIFFLETDPEANRARIAKRGKLINEATLNSKIKGLTNLRTICEKRGVSHQVVDNNPPLEQVAAVVWNKIYKDLKKQRKAQ